MLSLILPSLRTSYICAGHVAFLEHTERKANMYQVRGARGSESHTPLSQKVQNDKTIGALGFLYELRK